MKKATIIALVIISALVLMMCPIPFLMLTSTQMILMSLVALAFVLWVAFHWHERVADEREELHRFLAGRVAYFVGAGILLLGILVQSLQHQVDHWLVGALIGMILAKILSQGVTERYY